MQVDKAVRRNLEQAGGNHLSIGHHDDGFDATLSEPRIDGVRFQVFGLQAIDLTCAGRLDHRRRCEDLVSTNRAIRSRHDQRDLVATGCQPLEGGRGEFRSTEEDDFHDAPVYNRSLSHHDPPIHLGLGHGA